MEGIKLNLSKNQIRLVVLILFVAIVVITTICLIVARCKVNKQQIVVEQLEPGETNIQVNKKESEDLKYIVTDFKERYYINPLTIEEKYYTAGKIKTSAGEETDKINIQYIEISGLKNSTIQTNINNEIKQIAYKYEEGLYSTQKYAVYTKVVGNFSNILSIEIYMNVYNQENDVVKSETAYLNYNLATGDKIKFLDLFASNTPMNSIIYDIAYESLAWNTYINLDMSETEWNNATNMDKRDTSDYEDILLKAIRKYENMNKDNIAFSISPDNLKVILDLGIDEEVTNEYNINLYKYAQYITIYKKFLTDENIFSKQPTTELTVFNEATQGITVEYSKFERENLYILVYSNTSIEEEHSTYLNQVNTLKNQYIKQFIQEANSIAEKDKLYGYIIRIFVTGNINEYSNDYGNEDLISIHSVYTIQKCSLDYFENSAFKSLAKQSAKPKVSIDEALVGLLDDNNMTMVTNSKFDINMYYNLSGTYVADNYKSVEKYIDSKYKEPVENNNNQVNIYSE